MALGAPWGKIAGGSSRRAQLCLRYSSLARNHVPQAIHSEGLKARKRIAWVEANPTAKAQVIGPTTSNVHGGCRERSEIIPSGVPDLLQSDTGKIGIGSNQSIALCSWDALPACASIQRVNLQITWAKRFVLLRDFCRRFEDLSSSSFYRQTNHRVLNNSNVNQIPNMEAAENQVLQSKHSKLGIASFVLSIVVGVLILVAFVVAGILGTMETSMDTDVLDTVVGFVFIALLGLEVVTIGLGIASLFQPGTRRVFGILGLTFSVLTVIGSVGLMILGLVYGE